MSSTTTETLTSTLAATTLHYTLSTETTTPSLSHYSHPQNIASNLNTIFFTILPCTDYARAQKFYGDVFGWTFTPGTPEVQDQDAVVGVLWNAGNTKGGLVKVMEEKVPSLAVDKTSGQGDTTTYSDLYARMCPRVCIAVESIDSKLEEIKKAGGTVYLPKRKISYNPGHGAYFTDSEGNVLSLWSMY